MEQMAAWERKWCTRPEEFSNKPGDKRNEYETDYARVIHSSSFRRLQGKTQILNLGDSDFYRTRLTHSMEVSQVACGIIQNLSRSKEFNYLNKYIPSQTLMQTICLVHDLGHPPFGHGGEIALNYCMKDNGGFEGNGQTLRILSKLEKFSENSGSNLTRRSYIGILKYPAPYSKVKNNYPQLKYTTSGGKLLDIKNSKPPKCYLDTEEKFVEWLLRELSEKDREEFIKTKKNEDGKIKTIHKSFDCSIMELADDISYGVHDLEDAIALKLVNFDEFLCQLKETGEHFTRYLSSKYEGEFDGFDISKYATKLFDNDGKIRKRQISRMVNYFLSFIEIGNFCDKFDDPMLCFRVSLPLEQRKFLDSLQEFVVNNVIKSPNVQHLEFKGQQMVIQVFDTFMHDPKRFLPTATYKKFEENDKDSRIICDHIAGMTDSYLLKIFERLYSPRMGSVFDQL
ncbi:dGTPase [Iodidimonas gelatinilytica]|uniref:Deoxyguanosinetriphosphate triphosphohydrolase-like protein n=1 Tax=Iodidimonas gelatinilytica TaxID=1236966 RepID=A0A5A7MTM4_9PROT|nr:anti-phage deoxyguanosine triphosphatase [Iodidimonas gelatinilytica]GEQ98964.1 dGTPase [Iodidimonas gelatinilytica]